MAAHTQTSGGWNSPGSNRACPYFKADKGPDGWSLLHWENFHRIKSRRRMQPSLRQTQSSMTNRRLTSNRDPICGSRLGLLCVWSQKLLTERKGRAEAVWGSLEEKHAGCGWIPPHYNPSTVCLCGDECYTSGLSRSHACKAHKQTHTEPFIKKPPRPHNALKGAVSSHTPK